MGRIYMFKKVEFQMKKPAIMDKMLTEFLSLTDFLCYKFSIFS